ncbi:MAG: GTP pyrophosphokinase [Actinobacteria bacterium RBG_16_70_17]|nr:MAG: GTP pyrophosphokinase [Actinobacteria bacterium RBG_16_70_17]
MTLPEDSAAGTEEVPAELEPVLSEFRRHFPAGDRDLVLRAYAAARQAHEGQVRRTGDPYITHPLAVAHILAGYGLDAETIAAALLHDALEDTALTLDQVRATFGDTVADLIDGVTKLDRVSYGNLEEAQAATIRKMVIAMARDVRVLLIKLADRLHNVRTLYALPEEKQLRIAALTLDVYAPLAHRLGVQRIKHELEDRCFAILHPLRHAEIQELLRTRAAKRDAYIEEFVAEVEKLLAEQDIPAIVSGRPKHSYSIYRKMVDAGRPFEEIHDLIGIRIITRRVADCYAALGMVHTHWPPVQGRFKDYIAMPKFNLYQSLHTTVLGPDRKPIEVQIRTEEMHERAERGIAAHWVYKEGTPPEEVEGVRSIAFLPHEYENPEEFLANLKLDLYQDEVFVLTPKGEVKSLPRGATPVDLAYAVHTEVGHRCNGARVNGRLVPLSTRLESGDIVEILTTKSEDHGPSRDWLGFVRTARAAAKIRQWFSREHREVAVGEGREQVARLLRREGLGLSAAARDAAMVEVAASLGFHDAESLYQAVGEGGAQAATVVLRVVRLVRPEEAAPEEGLPERLPPPRERPVGKGIIVEGLEDMWVRLARCCSPVPGDDIVGFVTVGRGVSVHRADCTNIGALGAERMVEVEWGAQQTGAFSAWMQVEALDRPKLLRDVIAALGDVGLDITASSSRLARDRTAVLLFQVEVAAREDLARALAEVKGVEGVFDAFRAPAPGGGER